MRVRILSIVFLLVFLYVGTTGSPAYSQERIGLFRDSQVIPEVAQKDMATGPPVAVPAGENAARPIIVRKRVVQIDPKHIVGKGNEHGAVSLELNLFDDVKLSAMKDRVEQLSATDYIWFGSIRGDKSSYVIMVVGEELIAGNIVFNGKMFQVRYAGQGAHKVQEVDTTAFPNETCDEAPQFRNYSSFSTTTIPCNAVQDSGSNIDVLVVYSSAAANAAGGDWAMYQQIQLGIAETNMSYSNSGIVQRVRLAHAEKIAFTEPGLTSLKLSSA